MKRALLLFSALALAACTDQTSVLVTVMGPPLAALTIDATIMPSGRAVHQALIESQLQAPIRIIITLPDDTTSIEVGGSGTDSAGRPVNGSATRDVSPHHQNDLALILADGVDLGEPPSDGAPPDLSSGPAPSLTVLAGLPGGGYSDQDGIGADARLYGPTGIVVRNNTAFVVDYWPGHLRKIDLTTFAVTSIPLKDAVSLSDTYLAGASDLVSDGAGGLYVACQQDHTIRHLDPATGKVSLLAGTPGMFGTQDGAVAVARFNAPSSLALDGAGNLYVSDGGSHTLRKIVLSGPTVSTIAGTPGTQAIDDGAGAAAHFAGPQGLTLYGGDLYVADGSAVRKVVLSATAQVTTIVPAGTMSEALGIVSDGAGKLLVADQQWGNILEVVLGATPSYSMIVGIGTYDYTSIDGIGPAARLAGANSFALDGAGNVYFTEQSTVRRFPRATLDVKTVAGTAMHAGTTDSPPRLSWPTALAYDGADTLYVAEREGQRVRKYSLSAHTLSAFVGSKLGEADAVDGIGDSARFHGPQGLALDGAGNLFVADSYNHTIRRVSAAGDVKTIAGIHGMPKLTNGAGAVAQFNLPLGLAFDGDHTLFIADSNNNVLRTLDTRGPDFTVATLAGTGDSTELDGAAAAATFAQPSGLAYDRTAKHLYVADEGGNTVRDVDLTNPLLVKVSLLSGVAFSGGANNGTSARYSAPIGLALDPSGTTLYVADFGNQLVRRLNIANKLVDTIAGQANVGLTKAGALPAFVHAPYGVLATQQGLYITSSDENTLLFANGY